MGLLLFVLTFLWGVRFSTMKRVPNFPAEGLAFLVLSLVKQQAESYQGKEGRIVEQLTERAQAAGEYLPRRFAEAGERKAPENPIVQWRGPLVCFAFMQLVSHFLPVPSPIGETN